MEKDSGSLGMCLGLPFSVWQAACDAHGTGITGRQNRADTGKKAGKRKWCKRLQKFLLPECAAYSIVCSIVY